MIKSAQIRRIQQKDNPFIAHIIRCCLEEFGANKPGTVYYDKSTDHLSVLFEQPQSHYFIAELEGQIVGGGGIFASHGLPSDCCELVKMYLLPQARGVGIGAALLKHCIVEAQKEGFKKRPRPCNKGPKCRYHKKSSCKWWHPAEPAPDN